MDNSYYHYAVKFMVELDHKQTIYPLLITAKRNYNTLLKTIEPQHTLTLYKAFVDINDKVMNIQIMEQTLPINDDILKLTGNDLF